MAMETEIEIIDYILAMKESPNNYSDTVLEIIIIKNFESTHGTITNEQVEAL